MSKDLASIVGLPTASAYQVAIFQFIKVAINKLKDGVSPHSLLIEAKPGSGKTTTGVAATRLIPADVSSLFVAFSKKIAEELALRLPSAIPARTFHAHWLKQWGRSIYNRHKASVKVDNYKVRNAVEKHFRITRFNRNDISSKIREQADAVIFLVEKAKMFGVVPHGYCGAESVPGYEDNDSFWFHVIEHFHYLIDPDMLKETIKITRKILRGQLDNEVEVDFDDMLYLPAVKQCQSERYQIVLIDEAQDLNSLQRYLLSRMVEKSGMIIAIGDRRQSIFAFRGADAESMQNIKTDFSCDELPLSISYRCARKIVDLAYSIFPEIEAAPEAPEGSVEYPENFKIEEFRPGHLIVCRNNAPTISLVYRLLRHRIPAKVLGRDIGQGLIKLIQRLDVDNSLSEFMGKLRTWCDHQIILINQKDPNNERAKEQITDKYECIATLAMSEEIGNVKELLDLIDQMFTSAAEEKQAVSSTRVTLSTIHKIKGAEADTVFILDPQLINPCWIRTKWEADQERNLEFVAITRAKTRLVFLTSDSIRS